jgi:DNA-binding transcriptional LysR family regulator
MRPLGRGGFGAELAFRMEMHQVRYFLAVSDELNFTRAAEKCHVAQPSLTRAIKQLEDELGGRLFHRDQSGTVLTELGHAMRPYLAEVARQSAQAKDAAAAYVSLKHTPLKLGVMCTIGPSNLVGLISGLQDEQPDIELQIADSDAKTLYQRLIGGELEAAICCLPETVDDRLHLMPLFREQFMIALAKRHRLANRNAVRAADLNGERYLNRANCEYANIARDVFTEAGTKVQRVYRSERDDWILAMVEAGLGFGFMPQHCIPDRADIVVRPLIEPEIWREISLVTVRGRPHSPALGVLVHQAMQTKWMGAEAIAVQRMRAEPELMA